jgi:DNA mismatch repair protein MutS
MEALLPMLAGTGAGGSVFPRAGGHAPTERAQGGFIAQGYDADLDHLRSISKDARQACRLKPNTATRPASPR